MPETISADYVVVGAGSSGAVIANRLSANPDCSVVLLEAGGWDDRPEIHQVDAASNLSLLTSEWRTSIDWGYATEKEEQLNGREIPIAQGKVIGGSSSVNALMWVRGNPADYDRWAEQGNPGWSFTDLLPYFMRSETYVGAGARRSLRGTSGPIQVRALDEPSPIAEAFVGATRELGYAASDQFDYNGPRQDGHGFFYQSTRTRSNLRSSTAAAYLASVMDRANLEVKVGAQATRLVLEGTRVVGVEYLQDGEARFIAVGREVVLSAGAFESPKLLLLSGIGAAAHLEEHGIPVVRDLPGVGRNLQDHLFVPICYESTQEHPRSALLSEAGLFTHTGEVAHGFVSPDLQFTFGPIKFLPSSSPAEHWTGPGFTFAPIALLPQSRGEITLSSTDPTENVEVRANYLDHDADLNVLVHGLTLARQLAATRAFDPFRGVELAPGPDVVTDEEIREFIRANATTLWHPVGTCRMGDDDQAVVDAELRVRGIDQLRIADASIMPEIIAGNTNATCVAIGEKAADLILAGYSRSISGGLK